MNNIYLIGMMGSGKSTIGLLLAKQLECSFVDTDDYIIENSSYNSINEIFKKKKESYFRNIESEALKKISLGSNCIIATGGGIILKAGNISLMKKTGKVIYLESSVENLVKNLYNTKCRPLLKNKNLTNELELLLKRRERLYNNASNTIVDVTFKSKNDIVDLIISTVKR
ncbi:MAG: shikimate kinase [Bacillota bacterium]|nr:shikimate kinase [Bacillota bacterium]